MRTIAISLGLLLATMATAVQAANEWGIDHEAKARFEATVVDVLCELTGDCPAQLRRWYASARTATR